MRMRTIDAAYDHVRAVDPETALTKTALRRLVTSGIIPSTKIGAKYLLDLDILENYFTAETQVAPSGLKTKSAGSNNFLVQC